MRRRTRKLVQILALPCTVKNLSNSMLKKYVLQRTIKNLSNSMLKKHGKVTVDYFQCLPAIITEITERYKNNGKTIT